MRTVLLDTGPFVAMLDGRDAWHQRILEALRSITEPLITCEPVVAESCFLLRQYSPALQTIDRWLADGQIRLDFSLAGHHQRVFAIMRKYADLPASLADASLVAMAETHTDCRILTLDKHFDVYRTLRRRVIPRVAV